MLFVVFNELASPKNETHYMTEKETQFTRMVKEQKNTIYTVCMMFGDDAPVDDLVQETIINLWKGYDSFEGRSSVNTWVWRVAMNTCISATNKENRRSRGKTSLDALNLSDKDIADAPKEDKQIKMLHDRIHRLGVFDRAIILLWLEELSYDEIGQIVGISPDNVSVRLVRIREQLKKMK